MNRQYKKYIIPDPFCELHLKVFFINPRGDFSHCVYYTRRQCFCSHPQDEQLTTGVNQQIVWWLAKDTKTNKNTRNLFWQTCNGNQQYMTLLHSILVFVILITGYSLRPFGEDMRGEMKGVNRSHASSSLSDPKGVSADAKYINYDIKTRSRRKRKRKGVERDTHKDNNIFSGYVDHIGGVDESKQHSEEGRRK